MRLHSLYCTCEVCFPQRYQRLKQEVAELVSDVEHVRDGQTSAEKMLEVSPVDLAQDVKKDTATL